MVVAPATGVVLHGCDSDPPTDGLPDEWDPAEEDDWDPDAPEDEDPPKCIDCGGKGKYILFHLEHDCDTCGGSGY